jgi:pimeloyl-ACP methyl ester carboxylesterase
MCVQRSVLIADGVRLPLHAAGKNGPLVVLLHGYYDSHRTMAPLAALLAPAARVVAPTQRGHGDADKPHAGYGIADLADDVAALLDALGEQRAVIVGHSMSAAVAATFAAAYPARVEKLVLMGAFADFDTAEVRALNAEVVSDRSRRSGVRRGLPGEHDRVAGHAGVLRHGGGGKPQAAGAGVEGAVCGLPAVRPAARAFACPCADADRLGRSGRVLLAGRSGRAALGNSWRDASRPRERGPRVHWERPEAVAADIGAFVTARA